MANVTPMKLLPISSRVETIDADRARAMLTKSNPTNRTVSRTTVAMLARAMQRGEWRVTNEGIGVSRDGVILDGHHRLQAVVLSGVSVQMLVTYNIDPSSIFAINRGKSRTLANVARMVSGAPDRHLLETTRFFVQAVIGAGGTRILDTELFECAAKLEPHWNRASHICELSTGTRRISAGLKAGAVVSVILFGDRAFDFILDLVRASRREILGDASSVNVLRWLENRGTSAGGQQAEIEKAGAIIRGVEQFAMPQSQQHIKVTVSTVRQKFREANASAGVWVTSEPHE